MKPTLVVMAAGMATRFGSPKQLVPVGPAGEALLDYTILDAVRAGFGRVVMITRAELQADFRAHIADVIGPGVPVAWVTQRLDDLPGGYWPPAGRARPWGTAHALRAARRDVTGPFAACNADDYYGPGAFHLLAEHFADTAPTGPPLYALTGYRLDSTLSPHGGVARAVATTGADRELARLVEVLDLRADPAGGAITGRSVAGAPLTFTGSELVSMNLWGFGPEVFASLEAQLSAFLPVAGHTADAELRLSDAIGEQVAQGLARVRVLEAPDRWFGLTYAADLAAVRESIAERIAAGVYPADLRRAFSP
jgi:NDP-sugar pyrophosphorylase family protein